MDRPIDSAIQTRQRVRRILFAVALVAALLVAFAGFRRLITPSIDANRIRTAVVIEGSIEATISASGTVVPLFEEVVSSPIDSRILEVLGRPGESVRRGDPILVLDTSATRLDLDNVNEQIALKQNERQTEQLELERALIEQKGRVELKQVDLESHRARHRRIEQLFEDGLSAESELLEAALDIRRAEIELRQLDESTENLKRSSIAELERLELEKKILIKQREAHERLLELATAKAVRDGVLTWVAQEEGATVRQGDVLARVADLDRFRVDATVSDVYSQRLSAGQPARIKIDGEFHDGRLRTVLPTIQNGTVTLLIELDDPAHASLRSNLRVEVFIITDAHERVLKVKKGPFANGSGPQEAFVVRDGLAHRTTLEIGMSSFDDLEIVAGASAGDEIVISDMTDYMHMQEVPIH